MVARVQELSIEEFSKAFIAHQRLPRSCKLVVLVMKDRRAKRSDTLVKMYPLRMPRVSRVDEDSNVSDLLAAAKSALSTDLDARGWELQLHSDDGRIFGNQRIKTLLREDGNRQEELRNDDEVERLLAIAEGEVWGADATAENAEVTVPKAYLRALVAMYGVRPVRHALQSL